MAVTFSRNVTRIIYRSHTNGSDAEFVVIDPSGVTFLMDGWINLNPTYFKLYFYAITSRVIKYCSRGVSVSFCCSRACMCNSFGCCMCLETF
ncbi:hypothetical protein HanRHA438_Chr02g0096701 [Helianthus annuus]|nr:hypothetical protein HanRHA438_Chr02g0096701 [Helianthus annuus]